MEGLQPGVVKGRHAGRVKGPQTPSALRQLRTFIALASWTTRVVYLCVVSLGFQVVYDASNAQRTVISLQPTSCQYHGDIYTWYWGKGARDWKPIASVKDMCHIRVGMWVSSICFKVGPDSGALFSCSVVWRVALPTLTTSSHDQLISTNINSW